MVQLTRIYTRGGDKGKASLGDGTRLLKSDPRFMAIGDVDEANSAIGVARLYVSQNIEPTLRRIQNDLFDVGADLCMPKDTGTLKITDEQVTWLEGQIDALNQHLSPLTTFVLPGGSHGSSYLHLARAVTRRAERTIVDLMGHEQINPTLQKYMNRLSDYLFVAARYENNKGQDDFLWKPGLGSTKK